MNVKSVGRCSTNAATRHKMRIAVGIATTGRPAVVAEAVKELARQTRTPDRVIVCAPSPRDFEGVSHSTPDAILLTSPRGLTIQRNCILRHAYGFELLLFLDDDFVPSPRYIETMEDAFARDPAVVLATGRLLADGICGTGLSWPTGRCLLDERTADPPAVTTGTRDIYSAYGCNMAVRLATVRDRGIEFDEGLPLYGWLEDVDFSRRLAAAGRVVIVPAAHGVHLGVKLGRETGIRLGYSQIANPLYLVRKGTYSPWKALLLMARNVTMNCGRALRPEPYVDRPGRARGNGLAVIDWLTGRLQPTRILAL